MSQRSRKETVKDIGEAIQKNSFRIDEKVYAPLHATSYPSKILKELQKKGYLLRCGTLRKVLLEHGLTNRYYWKMCGRNNAYHQLTTCFEVLKKII